MKQIPSTIVLSMFLLVFASWPSIDIWGDTNLLRHLGLHACYFLSGALLGLQMSWWATDAKNRYTALPKERMSS